MKKTSGGGGVTGSSWDSLKDVRFAGEGGAEVAEERTADIIEEEIERFIETSGDKYFEDGQIGPESDPEKVEEFTKLCDEYFQLKLKEASNVRDLVDFSGLLGGRYDNLPVSENGVTVAQVESFYDAIGRASLVETESGLYNAMFYNQDRFGIDEIKSFHDQLISEDAGVDSGETIQRYRAALTKVLFEMDKRDMSAGAKSDLSEYEIKLFDRYISEEDITNSPEISSGYFKNFQEVLSEFADNPEKEYSDYSLGYLTSPTMRKVVDGFIGQDTVIGTNNVASTLVEGAQVLGEAIAKGCLSFNDGEKNAADSLIWLSSLGFSVSGCAPEIFLDKAGLQRRLAEAGMFSKDDADRLYIAGMQTWREGGYGRVDSSLECSGEDEAAKFWAENQAEIGEIFQNKPEQERAEILTEDLCLADESLEYIIKKASEYGTPDGDARVRFILKNRGLFQEKQRALYNKFIIGYSMYDCKISEDDEMTAVQQVTIDTYLDMLSDEDARKDASRFRNFMLVNMGSILPENVGAVNDVLSEVGLSESQTMKMLEMDIAKWVLFKEKDDVVAKAGRMRELVEEGKFKELFDVVPDFAEKMFFEKIGTNLGEEDSGSPEQRRQMIIEYLRTYDLGEDQANRLFLECMQKNIVDPDADEFRYTQKYIAMSPEQITRMAEASRQITREIKIPDIIHGAVMEQLSNNKDINTEELVEQLGRFFTEKINEQSFSETFPGLSNSVFRDCFEIFGGKELSDVEKKILDTYMIMAGEGNSDRKMKNFKDFLLMRDDAGSPYRYENLSLESIDDVSDILMQLYDSNSAQLSRLAPQLASKILELPSEEAHEQTNKLEQIFLRRNIPDFAKLYCCASVLFEDTIDNETDISPVLKEADDRRAVLMTDLLRVSIRSNNASLREYLEGVINGEEASEQENPSETEAALLEEFISGKKFRTRFFGYAWQLGFNNAGEILQAMDKYRIERDRAHRESLIEDSEGHLRLREPLKAGDFVKGIRSCYIDTMMSFGFNCPEMLGDAADQDCTHWDTDFGSVEEDGIGITKAINGSIARGYGDGVYIILRNDSRFAHTFPGETMGYADFSKYEAYHGKANGESFRGIRSGLGSEDVDFYVVNDPNSKRTRCMKYEIAKHGCYTPIIDKTSGDVIFSPDEYSSMRASMGGAERYGSDLREFRFVEDLSLPEKLTAEEGMSFENLVLNFDEKEAETRAMQIAVTDKILAAIEASGLPEEVKKVFRDYRTEISRESIPGSVDSLSTGSTGRFTNKPHDADFDFVWRIDKAIEQQYGGEIMRVLAEKQGDNEPVFSRFGEGGGVRSAGIRKGIADIIVDGEPVEVEVDISPVIKTDKLLCSSDQALSERFMAIRKQDPEKYKQVIANIVIAKQVLKAGQVYKKLEGGIGGIGVENWILQNGGSLRMAAKSFLGAAESGDGDNIVPFTDFCARYTVFDLGENHLANGYPYDNFIDNLNADSYRRMIDVCRRIIEATGQN